MASNKVEPSSFDLNLCVRASLQGVGIDYNKVRCVKGWRPPHVTAADGKRIYVFTVYKLFDAESVKTTTLKNSLEASLRKAGINQATVRFVRYANSPAQKLNLSVTAPFHMIGWQKKGSETARDAERKEKAVKEKVLQKEEELQMGDHIKQEDPEALARLERIKVLKARNHYDWLTTHFNKFAQAALGKTDDLTCMIPAHGDKCYHYRNEWEAQGIPFAHGVAVYLLSYVYPYTTEVRETKNGWVTPKDWVVERYEDWKDLLPAI